MAVNPYLTQAQEKSSIFPSTKRWSAFDTLTRTWTQSFQHPAHGTHYLSFNKFYSAKDSSIYMLAGYGHFRYKSSIHKYHIPSNTWDSLSFGGDPLFPHYLGAMGVDRDSVYLLGGYGSTTGDQMLNPKISNDFVLMNVESKTFKTLGEIKFPFPEAVWANSLVIDEASNTMYGLMFPRNKFKSFLQLVSMSKDGKNFQELGSTIPFDFHDIKSFADFFYSKASNRFVAVTLFYDSALSQSRVRIYSLLAPALPNQILEGSAQSKSNNWILISGLVTLAGLGLLQFIREERERELCFENHHWWDIKRWRIADVELNNFVPNSLMPYLVLDELKYKPNGERINSYIFIKEREPWNKTFNFEKKWYYEPLPGGELNKNPNLYPQNPIY
ncbi:RagB/SusD family nutrient uptake outer membrane protein [Sphingobacterium mizutaii]|nr:RagB/SusD family nutrient uptake outer membrane protein [Sphingobacterium mizutaii]